MVWIPVKQGPKQQEKKHMRAEKAEVGAGPRLAGKKLKKENTRVQRKQRVGRVPVKPEPKFKKKHMRAEKEEGRKGPR